MIALLTALLAGGCWWLLVGASSRHEVWVGAAAAIVTASAMELVRRTEPLKLAPNAADLAQVLRVPWLLLTGSLKVAWLLLRDLAGQTRTASLFSVARYELLEPAVSPSGGARDRLRRVLAVALSSISPDMIVLGIDVKGRLLLCHQLQPGPLSTLTIRLIEAPR